MRSKILLALGLFVALSGGSAYAQVTSTHNVTTTLTEVRDIDVVGAVSFALKKSTAGSPVWQTDTTSTLTVEHDLLIPQKVTVHTAAIVAPAWQGRSLRVLTTLPAAGWGTAPLTPALPTTLITDGASDALVASAKDFITVIGATESAPGTPGVSPATTLTYSGKALGSVPAVPATDAIVGSTDVIAITYTLMDQ